MSTKTHNNLPKSDRNERLERLSNRALERILSVEKFLSREDKPDKGVDSSIEVIDENEDFTNFRAQIQLKGTYEQEINKDGSVSFSIETSNIRYLWNNLTSIYVLYIQPREELRFVWLKDEINRLDKENPNWQKQGEVTLRFNQILDEDAADKIHTQITKEGLFHRKIKEVFNSNSEGNFRIELNPSSLEITDPKQAKNFLMYHNVELLNAGYENLILEKYNLLTDADKKNINLLLLKAAAEDSKGNYKTALDILGSIELLGETFTKKQTQFCEMIENNCNWKIGIISDEEHKNKLKDISERKTIENPILDEFNHLSSDFRGETHQENRVDKLEELRMLVDEILLHNEVSDETKTGIQITLLGCESEQFLSEYCSFHNNVVGNLIASQFPKLTYLTTLFDEIVNFNAQNVAWYEKANILFKATNNSAKQAEIGQYDVRHWLNSKRSEKFFCQCFGQNFEVIAQEFKAREEIIKTVIQIWTQLGKNYEIVQTKGMLAELLSFAGKVEEAEELRLKNNVIAEKMSYKNLVVESFMETHLKEFLKKYKF